MVFQCCSHYRPKTVLGTLPPIGKIVDDDLSYDSEFLSHDCSDEYDSDVNEKYDHDHHVTVKTPDRKKRTPSKRSSPLLGGKYTSVVSRKEITLPYKLFSWLDGNHDERTTVLVHMPSGLEDNKVKANIVSGGRSICITLPFPTLATDLDMYAKFHNVFHSKIKYTDTHTKMVALKKTIQAVGPGTQEATMNINLPFQVEEEFTNEEAHPGMFLMKLPCGDYGTEVVLQLELRSANRCKLVQLTKSVAAFTLEDDLSVASSVSDRGSTSGSTRRRSSKKLKRDRDGGSVNTGEVDGGTGETGGTSTPGLARIGEE